MADGIDEAAVREFIDHHAAMVEEVDARIELMRARYSTGRFGEEIEAYYERSKERLELATNRLKRFDTRDEGSDVVSEDQPSSTIDNVS